MSEDELVGVQARLVDARVLSEGGRYEGALLMLLVAVAATSKKRYPKDGDRGAFTRFLRDEIWRLVKEHDDWVQYRGQMTRIEEFLYKYLRCNLCHEGQLPADLQPKRDGDLITIDYGDGSGVSISNLLLMRLWDVVWKAPENSHAAYQAEIKKRQGGTSASTPDV